MPVIGRPDEQVNDVLIDPVGKRRRPRDDGDAEHKPSDERRGAACEDSSGVARDAADGESRPRADHGEDRARDDEQLPVWLL